MRIADDDRHRCVQATDHRIRVVTERPAGGSAEAVWDDSGTGARSTSWSRTI